MLWDTLHFNRTQWNNACEGNYMTKERPIIKHPKLKYYSSDNYSDLPLLRATVIGPPEMDEDYGYMLRPVLAIAEFKKFEPNNDPHGWSMPYISVVPQLQGQNVARHLFREALAHLKEKDPEVILHRTANSDSGKHWQHVADTELFAAKIPWTQQERKPMISGFDSKVTMLDFESPTAKMVDALQRKSARMVETLLHEHPGYDWSAPNDAYVHPLRAALELLPECVDLLLQAGANPTINAGWIGHVLLENPQAHLRWIELFEPMEQAKAFLLSVAGHTRVLSEHPSWNLISEEAKNESVLAIQESRTYTMRYLLPVKPSTQKSWDFDTWDEWGKGLGVLKTTLSLNSECKLPECN